MKEADIVRAILKYLKSVPGCFAWKEHGGMYGTAGIPDVICCYRGRFFGFEVKADTGLQMAACDGQCCGAKRPRCGAERPPFSLI